MTDTQERRHGLESLLVFRQADDGEAAGMGVQIRTGLRHINLRGDPDDADFIAATGSALGQVLPVTPNTLSSADHQIYWLGPDESLIITSDARSQDLLARLRKSLSGQHASVIDVTGGQVSMHLSGTAVRDVLAKGCTLDFDPGVFKAGTCAQSALAKANVLLGLINDQPTFELIVRRSFGKYLMLWLEHAAQEFGVEISVG